MANTPTHLGDFEILRELGRGGMGIVYEARQTSLNRKVALKVLSSGLGLNPRAVIRFRREAEAAAKLHHTNIVPIYGTGEVDGVHYYAMELIDGPSLDQVIRHLQPKTEVEEDSGPVETTSGDVPDWVDATIAHDLLPPSQSGSTARSSNQLTGSSANPKYFDTLARMMADVADALHHAHDQGVIHRDIKPSNLLLGPDGRLSLNDFGLARVLEKPGVTITGEFVGTPRYMSPEQITAGRAPLDYRTDIYSLGATLYELLTLSPPFDGRARDEVVAQILHKDPRPPRRVSRRVPADLETICLKAMEKDPDRRYETAKQLADDLRRYTDRHAILARRVGPLGKTAKWIRRRPAVASLLACVLLVGMVATWFAYDAWTERVERRAATGQQAITDALVAIFRDDLEQAKQHLQVADASRVDPRRVALLRGMVAHHLYEDAAALQILEAVDEQFEGKSLATKVLLDWTHLRLGDLKKASLARRAYRDLKPRTDEDYLYGGIGFTDDYFDTAIDWLESLAAEQPLPRVLYALGRAHDWKLTNTYAVGQIDRTIEVVDMARGLMRQDLAALRRHAGAHATAADIYRLRGDSERSAHHLREARETAQHMLDHHPEEAMTYQVNADLAAFEGEWERALEFSRKANQHATSFDDFAALAPLLYRSGRVKEAVEAFDQFPAKIRRSLEIERVLYIAELEGVEAALTLFHDWLRQIREEHDPSRAVHVYATLAIFGQLDQAKRHSQEYLAQVGPLHEPKEFWTTTDAFAIGEIEIEQLIEKAVTRFDRMQAHFLHGCTHLARGDREGAIKAFERVEQEGFPTWGVHMEAVGRRAAVLLHRMRRDETWPPWG